MYIEVFGFVQAIKGRPNHIFSTRFNLELFKCWQKAYAIHEISKADTSFVNKFFNFKKK